MVVTGLQAALRMMWVVPDDATWLRRFHAGERSIVEQCYRDHFAKVLAAASRVLGSVDAETVTHEVFYRVLSEAKVRESFHGGNMGAWLAQIASNAAIDAFRRRRREVEHTTDDRAPEAERAHIDEEALEAKVLIERFRAEKLPEKWQAVFEARFLRQLPQREAAKELGMQRTTLVYQEQRIRELIEDFLLGSEAS